MSEYLPIFTRLSKGSLKIGEEMADLSRCGELSGNDPALAT